MSWQMLLATSRLGRLQLASELDMGLSPPGVGGLPPTCCCCCCPTLVTTTSSAPNLKSKTATTALARETSSSPTLADCRWLDLWQVWFLRQAKCWHKQAPLMGTKGWSLLWTLGDQMHKRLFSAHSLRWIVQQGVLERAFTIDWSPNTRKTQYNWRWPDMVLP